jgi:hypothetical protein
MVDGRINVLHVTRNAVSQRFCPCLLCQQIYHPSVSRSPVYLLHWRHTACGMGHACGLPLHVPLLLHSTGASWARFIVRIYFTPRLLPPVHTTCRSIISQCVWCTCCGSAAASVQHGLHLISGVLIALLAGLQLQVEDAVRLHALHMQKL